MSGPSQSALLDYKTPDSLNSSLPFYQRKCTYTYPSTHAHFRSPLPGAQQRSFQTTAEDELISGFGVTTEYTQHSRDAS